MFCLLHPSPPNAPTPMVPTVRPTTAAAPVRFSRRAAAFRAAAFRNAQWRRRGGFTLIELALVVVILGVAMTVVLLNLDGLVPSEQIKSAASAIANRLELARSEAAGKGVNYAMVYDLDNQEYWILAPVRAERARMQQGARYDEENEVREQRFIGRLPSDVRFRDVQLGENVKKTRGKVTIEITPLGTASGHIVNIYNEKTQQRMAIELNALTALVTYHTDYTDYREVEDFHE